MEVVCANIASDTIVKKLNLSCIKHPRPYRLQWLNEYGEVKIVATTTPMNARVIHL
jgi:hypothetical protein